MTERSEMKDRNGQEQRTSLLAGLDPGMARLVRILLLVLLVVMTGSVVYGIFGSRSSDLIKKNTELSLDIQNYKDLIDKRDTLVRDTEAYNASTRAILDTFGAGNTPEKTILFLDRVAAVSGMSIETVEFGQEVMIGGNTDTDEEEEQESGSVLGGVQTGDQLEAQAAAAERGESVEKDKDAGSAASDEEGTDDAFGDRQLFVYPVTFSFSSSYQGLKAALDYIGSYKERMSVVTFTSAYEPDTGSIAGSMTLNMYRLTGTGKTYVEPSLSGAPLGKNDLFA